MTSASFFLTHLNSTAHTEPDQAEFIIPRHVSLQSPDDFMRPSYVVLHFKGWRETWLGPFLTTIGLGKCLCLAYVGSCL